MPKTHTVRPTTEKKKRPKNEVKAQVIQMKTKNQKKRKPSDSEGAAEGANRQSPTPGHEGEAGDDLKIKKATTSKTRGKAISGKASTNEMQDSGQKPKTVLVPPKKTTSDIDDDQMTESSNIAAEASGTLVTKASATETGQPLKRRRPATAEEIETFGKASPSAAESSSASFTPVIHDFLQQKNVRDWNTNEVFTFLDANKNTQFGEEHIIVIREQEVAGIALLTLSEQKLIAQPYNLKAGPAAGIEQLVNDLKVAKGLVSGSAPQVFLTKPPSVTTVSPNAVTAHFLPATGLPFIPYFPPSRESFRKREREDTGESSTQKLNTRGKRKKVATDLAADDKEWSMFPIGIDTMVPEGNPTVVIQLHRGWVRLLHRSEMEQIERVLEAGGRCGTRSALRGGAGVGKSCVMLNAVYTARMQGWVVLYIPQAKKLMTMTSTVSYLEFIFRAQLSVSKPALQNIAEEDVKARHALNVLDSINNEKSWNGDDLLNHFLSYVNALSGIQRIPILIAIDQWNAFIEKSTNAQYNNDLAELFGNFSQLPISRGVYLVAVSSSLVQMNFWDGDSQLITRIHALTDEQMRVLVADLVYQHSLKIDLTSELFEIVKKETGYVTRLVCWLFNIWKETKLEPTTAGSPTDIVPKNVMFEFINESTLYYKMRVRSLLQRSLNPLRDYKFALWLLSGSRVTDTSSEGFRDAGLVDVNGEVPCEQARIAILSVLTEQRAEAIKVLASFGPCKWFAHELSFWSAFSPSGGNILVPVKNAEGVDCNPIALYFSRIRHQDKIPSSIADVEVNRLQFGDFIILAPFHPALDFVGYTVKGTLVLGQISISKYSGTDRHSVEILFQKGKLGTRDNIADFYLQCAGLPLLTRKDRESKKFPSHALFLYITTSTDYLSTSQHCDDAVFVIDRNVLVRYFGYPEELVN